MFMKLKGCFLIPFFTSEHFSIILSDLCKFEFVNINMFLLKNLYYRIFLIFINVKKVMFIAFSRIFYCGNIVIKLDK